MSLYSILKKNFPFELTSKQDIFLQLIDEFVQKSNSHDLFVLQGYAGTGKTTVISTVVNQLHQIGYQSVLLAPTGRAAKVISNYSGKQAYTIHRKIYHVNNRGTDVSFVLQNNKHVNTIFVVDEASMISDSDESSLIQGSSVLEDLISYVYTGKGCKLIFVGDTAQLPPIGVSQSPALNHESLSLRFHKEVVSIELDQVMRQEQESGILHNATQIRELLRKDYDYNFLFDLSGYNDVIRLVNGDDIQDAIYESYQQFGVEDTTFIVRSNKRANQYNKQIRTRILDQQAELSTGDLLMVVKNNYFWTKSDHKVGFIANGDIIEVLEIFKFIELYTFRFAKVKIRMIDYPQQESFEAILLLDTINSESASLTYEEQNRLYQEVMADYEDEKTNYKRYKKVKENEYFNALQVKFSYSVTCHKSQGGQWSRVFIEKPYLPEGANREYLRWLYTAITRAKDKLYLIGFDDTDFV